MPGTKHILVIRLSALGDAAMAVPVLRALALQHPELKVTVLSRPFFEPLFKDIPNTGFFAIDVKKRHKGFFGLLRLYRDLKKLNIDAVADLHNVLRSKVVTSLFVLSGKNAAVVDKGRAEKKALTREEDKIFRQLLPMTQRYADVFEKLGFPVKLDLPVFPEKQKPGAAVLALAGNKDRKWIGIAPFAKHDAKAYPQDLMQQVITALAENEDNRIFLFGAGEHEIEILKHFAGSSPNIIAVAGRLAFYEELQLIGNLDVMLSMDSGNAHLAAMENVPVVTLWGATHPFAGFYPFGQPMENALLADRKKYPMLPTSVYGNKEVEGYENAMRTIAPEKVVRKVEQILKSRE